MSYQTSYLPYPTAGLGSMPGKTSGTSLYSNSFRTRNASGGSSYNYSSTLSRPSSRPLPLGPGPLDSSGRKYETSRAGSTLSNRTGPLRADHGAYNSNIDSVTKRFSTSVTTGSSSRTTNDYSTSTLPPRHSRSRSLAATDRISDTVNAERLTNSRKIQLTGIDSHSVRASPRSLYAEDIARDRESRRDTHDLDNSYRPSSSRVGRQSNGSIQGGAEENVLFRNKENISRGISLSRDVDNRRRDSITDTQAVQGSKSLSRQSSSSSLSNVSFIQPMPFCKVDDQLTFLLFK